MDLILSREELITVGIILVVLFFLYIILREFRLMKTDARNYWSPYRSPDGHAI